jgi:enoyl-CoA hydratase
MSSQVLYEVRGDVAVITIDRPGAINAINRDVLDGLSSALDTAGTDPEVRGAVITGSGEKAFSAGADIELLSQAGPDGVRALAMRAVAVFRKAASIGKPTVAAINGYALGGGLELAEACMFRVAVEGALMGHPEVKIGAVAAWGGTSRLPRLVGLGRAAELLLTGRSVTAEEALQMGLVHRVVPRDSLMEEAVALLKEVSSHSPMAERYTWEAMQRGMDVTLEEALGLGAEYFGLAAETEDFQEGTDAFLKKRRAEFRGR